MNTNTVIWRQQALIALAIAQIPSQEIRDRLNKMSQRIAKEINEDNQQSTLVGRPKGWV